MFETPDISKTILATPSFANPRRKLQATCTRCKGSNVHVDLLVEHSTGSALQPRAREAFRVQLVFMFFSPCAA